MNRENPGPNLASSEGFWVVPMLSSFLNSMFTVFLQNTIVQPEVSTLAVPLVSRNKSGKLGKKKF
jgi:hypothetical protein